jgi:uncharacterized membrane protein YuzA (DUF378 family)
LTSAAAGCILNLDKASTRREAVKRIDVVALALVVVGALNWGLVGVARFDLVAAIFGLHFGDTAAITRLVYALVGLSGLWLAARGRAVVTMRTEQRATVTA